MAYNKLYQVSFIVVQMIRINLKNQVISPLIKDVSELVRLAGFGVSSIEIQQFFVDESEVPNDAKIMILRL